MTQPDVVKPSLTPAKRAGDIEYFPAGQKTYLAPLPLPTGAQPYCPYISDHNDVYLDFGGGMPNVFSYQVNLGGPFAYACLVAFGLPLIGGGIGVALGLSGEVILNSIKGMFFAAWRPAIYAWLAASTIIIRYHVILIAEHQIICTKCQNHIML